MGVVDEAVEDGVGVSGVAEYRRAPPFLIGQCRTSRSRTRATSYSVIDLRSSMSVPGAALPTWLSNWLTDASVRFGLPQRTSFRQEAR
jgi:hypothetical protein